MCKGFKFYLEMKKLMGTYIILREYDDDEICREEIWFYGIFGV